MCYSNLSSCTNTDKCSSAVNMDDIVLSATVNILGSEFKLFAMFTKYDIMSF